MLALGLTVFVPVAAVGEVSVTINAPDRVLPGSNFTATVNISQVVDLNSVQYEIVFDPSVLRLDDVTPGKVDSTAMPVQGFALVSPGKYRVLQWLMFNKVSGAGYLAVLHFYVVASLGGSSTMNLANGVLSNWQAQAILATWIGDSVSISSAESLGGGLPTTIPVSPAPETPGASAPEGNISEPAGNEGSADSEGTVSAESSGEEVTLATSPSSEAAAPPSSEAASPLSSEAALPPSSEAASPSSPEAAPAKPVSLPILWGVIAGVLVAGLLIFLQVRRRHIREIVSGR